MELDKYTGDLDHVNEGGKIALHYTSQDKLTTIKPKLGINSNSPF